MFNIQTTPFIERKSASVKSEKNALLSNILDGTTNGYIFENFLSQTEVTLILEGFRNCSESELIRINEGFTSFPMSFAQFDQMANSGIISEQRYHEESRRFITDFSHRFGVDVIAKMKEFFTEFGEGVKLEIPYRSKDNPYTPFTFRELFPGTGCLKAHCENLFFQEFPSFFDRISRFSIQDDQLSFFFVLQKPQKGGELTLYDLIWKDQQRRINDIVVSIGDGKEISFEDENQLKRNSYSISVGSLVIFSGGNIWHRVETVQQGPTRITLGGFLSFSPDKTKLYCWS